MRVTVEPERLYKTTGGRQMRIFETVQNKTDFVLFNWTILGGTS